MVLENPPSSAQAPQHAQNRRVLGTPLTGRKDGATDFEVCSHGKDGPAPVTGETPVRPTLANPARVGHPALAKTRLDRGTRG